MRTARVFQRLLGVEQAVIERVELVAENGEEVLVAAVRPAPVAAVKVFTL